MRRKKFTQKVKKSVTDLYGLTWVGARDACASKNLNLKFAFGSGVIRETQVMKSVPLIK